MKRWKIAVLLITLLVFTALELTSANTGAPPLGNTNAPGEQNCASCHNSFGLNTGNGGINILGVPREYVPGQTYNVEVALQDRDASHWGFELTVLNDRGDSVGTLSVTDSVRTELRTGSSGGRTREYVINTIAGNYAAQLDMASWRFDWTAPQQNAGPITFFTVGVAGDLDSSQRGDRVYSGTLTTRAMQVRAPAINFITPTNGPESGNTAITLRGEGFRPGLSITFDGIDAQGLFINETTATAVAPPHNSGPVDIRLSNTDGTSTIAARAFIYNVAPFPSPEVSFLTPANGATVGGTVVRINGRNFRPGVRAFFDGREAPTTFSDNNFIMATTPLHNPGPVKVTVLNPDGLSSGLDNAFNYEGPVPPPVIKLLAPVGGEIFSAGGRPIAIRWTIDSNGTPTQRLLLSTDGGQSFPIVLAKGLNASTTRFNLFLSEEMRSDQSRLRLEAVQPEATVTDETKQNFKIVLAPIIERVSPATSKAGTTKLDLQITGQNFAKDVIVEMNGVKLKTKTVTPTSITVKKVPHSVPGAYFIRVRNSDGGTSGSFLFTIAQ